LHISSLLLCVYKQLSLGQELFSAAIVLMLIMHRIAVR
jgi:hypothetical protein